MADGLRYKMAGNAFTMTVIRWIGRRIAAAHYFNTTEEPNHDARSTVPPHCHHSG